MGVVVHSLRDGDCLGVGERRRCIKAVSSSFQSLPFGQSKEILKPIQSTVSSHAFFQPRSPAGSLSRATTNDWRRSYA
jgi:hypothetical protein